MGIHSKATYIDYETGNQMEEKPEDMTHLRGNLLVKKTHPQIEFRGRLDTLEALIVKIQIMALDENIPELADELAEVISYVSKVLRAEVMNEPLQKIQLLGRDEKQLREESHEVKKYFGIEHPVPNASMGRLAAELNYLRTQVREAELAANRAFCAESGCSRLDIIEGMNRLSSGVYILLCKKVSGAYNNDKICS